MRAAFFLAAAVIFWGVCAVFQKQAVVLLGACQAFVLQTLAFAPVVAWVAYRSSFQFQTRGVGFAVGAGILGSLGSLMYFQGLKYTSGSIAALVGASNVLVTLVIFSFLGERLEFKQWIGVGLAIVANLLMLV